MKSPSLQEIQTKVETLEREINLQRPILEVIQDPFFILDQKEEFLKANPKGMDYAGLSMGGTSTDHPLSMWCPSKK